MMKKIKILQEIPPKIESKKFVSLDLEIFGADKKILHRPITGRFACLSIAIEPDLVYIVTEPYHVANVVTNLSECVWCFHHASFDLIHLRRWAHIPPRKRLWDTLIIEKILYGGFYDGFSLEALARRWLDIRLDKSTLKKFEKGNEDSLDEEMIYYAALDASSDLQIALKQRKVMKKRKKAWKIYTQIDKPALWAFLDFQGFRLDIDKWKQLAEDNQLKTDELKQWFPFNPNSPKHQVVPWLRKNGFRGLLNSQEKTLKTFIKKRPKTKAASVATELLIYRKISKRASTYGMNFIHNYLEDHNLIYPKFNVIGAETGRTSSSAPNIQNIPIREAPEYREPWIAREGHKLVVVDYDNQEPRIAAYLSRDKRLIKIFKNKKDIYIEVAKNAFGETITKDDSRRDTMKSLVLGTNYGLSAYGLAIRENISKDEAEKIINKYFNAFPNMGDWAIKQKRKTRLVETAIGRRIWLNPYNNQCERVALNAPIQGSAADMMKQAIAKMHINWKDEFDIPFAVVAQIHDEVILDVPEELAIEVAKFTEKCMVSVAERMCPGVPFVATAKIVDNWRQAK